MQRRAVVYGSALALLTVAFVLALAGVGEEAGKLSDWQAFALGVVQGLTELLPISSSGHLILVPWLGDWHYLEEHEDFNQTFDVALHLGTLVAVVAYFWDDRRRLVPIGRQARDHDSRREDRLARLRGLDPRRARRRSR